MYQMDGKLNFLLLFSHVTGRLAPSNVEKKVLGVVTHLENLVYIFRGIIESIFRLNVANKNQSDQND